MQTLRDIFKTSNILEITEHNLMLEPSHVIEWAKKEFVQEDVIRYEAENQEKLKQIMKQLDFVEKELFEGSDEQCQKKSKRSAEDLQKSKSKFRLTNLLSKLGCKKINNQSQ